MGGYVLNYLLAKGSDSKQSLWCVKFVAGIQYSLGTNRKSAS